MRSLSVAFERSAKRHRGEGVERKHDQQHGAEAETHRPHRPTVRANGRAVSANPGGRGGLYHKLQRLAREFTPERIRRFATLSRNARTLAFVGNRWSSPKVQHCPRQRSRGSVLSSDSTAARFSLSISTVLSRLAIVVEAPVRLHHHGPGARAVAEGEARTPLILIDAPLGHAVDESPTHLGLERLGRQAEPGRQEIRVDHDLPILDADDGGWALHARTPFTRACFEEWTRSAGMSGTKMIASYATASSSRLPEDQTWASINK